MNEKGTFSKGGTACSGWQSISRVGTDVHTFKLLLIETRFDGVIETNAIEPPEALDLLFDVFVVALPEGSNDRGK